MALTITQQPNAVTPGYNGNRFICLSDKIAEANFRYIYLINVGGETITIKQSPRPDGYGMIDVHRIIESYLKTDFGNVNSFFANNSNSWVSYSIVIKENYGTTPADGDSQTISIVAFNASPEYPRGWQNFMTDLIAGKYEIQNVNSKFLSNAPRTQSIGLNQKAYLYFKNGSAISSSVPGYELFVQPFNSGGGLFTGFVATTPFSTPNAANSFQRVAVGPADLSGSIDFTNVAGYRVTLRSATTPTPIVTSETFTFKIDSLCSQYLVYRLHFLNQLGGFDAFNFKYKDTLNTDIVRTTYEKLPGTFNTGTYSIAETDRGVITNDINYTDRITINSNWVSDVEALWLKELITSPEVYWEDESGNFTPVTLTLKNYETQKSNKAAPLHNITLEFNLAQQNRQRF